MRLRAELTTEPFMGEGGERPAHVRAAAAALERAGLEPDLGPLGTSVAGEAGVLLPALADAIAQAFDADATRLTLQVATGAGDSQSAGAFLAGAVGPLVQRLHAELVPPGQMRPGDVPLAWGGSVRWGVRLPGEPPPDLADGLAAVLAELEQELGGPLHALSRRDKQRAVRLLEDRGAFAMRRAAEVIAEALGVSRFTVYNYLNRDRAAPPAPRLSPPPPQPSS